jgi:lipoate-protein ligase A
VLKETQFRLLSDPSLGGAVNMARDEALMVQVGRGESPPTLRLYQWNEPTISLGYFQPFAQFEAMPALYNKLAVVRRPTGGGAILHDLELTYSITVPIGYPLIADGANRLYEHAHDAVIAALGALGVEAARCGTSDESGAARGPFYCFARRHCYDVMVGADKIAGSAQRRTRAAVLQHGSIVLANRFTDQPTATVPMPFEEAIARMRAAFPDQFARVCGLGFEPGEMTDEELETEREFMEKYAGIEWTRRT